MATATSATAVLTPAEAERVTGYHIGGISPFGQHRRAAAYVDETALAFATASSLRSSP